ncbi:hypothetical protein PG991_013080 [Apiospora marii]|uniref:Uncharacterized protein n=1 Tax=Apiospora marii TaxID=335849 RepID=A0ABR1R5B3_9PEZI
MGDHKHNSRGSKRHDGTKHTKDVQIGHSSSKKKSSMSSSHVHWICSQCGAGNNSLILDIQCPFCNWVRDAMAVTYVDESSGAVLYTPAQSSNRAVQGESSSSMEQPDKAITTELEAMELEKTPEATTTGSGEASSSIEQQAAAITTGMETMKLGKSQQETETDSRGFSRQQENEDDQQAQRDASRTDPKVSSESSWPSREKSDRTRSTSTEEHLVDQLQTESMRPIGTPPPPLDSELGNKPSEPGSAADYEKDYLRFFLNEFCQDIAGIDRTSIESSLPCMLEEFAIRLGSQEGNYEHQRMMYIVYINRENIARHLCRAEDLSIEETDCSDDEDQGTRTPTFYGDSTNINYWSGSLETPDDSDAHFPPESPILLKDMLEDRLNLGRARLRGSQAYVWLIHALSCRGDLDGTVSYTLEAHRSWLLEKLRNNTPLDYRRVSRRKRPSIYTAVVQLPWNLPRFIKEQEYEDIHVPGIVGRVITLTGKDDRVYAATCMEYMMTIWPSTGTELAAFFEELLKEPGRNHTREISNKVSISCYISKDITHFKATGPAYGLVECVQQFLWLATALQTPTSDPGASLNSISMEGDFIAETLPAENRGGEHVGHCWLPLFRHSVIVDGYPIPRRPTKEPGLEISLGMMASLACADRIAPFCGTLLLKGFSTLIYAKEVLDDCVFWHLVFNEDGSRISFADDRVKPYESPKTSLLTPEDVFEARHIDFKEYRPEDPVPELRVQGNQVPGNTDSMVAYNILSDRENKRIRLHEKNDQTSTYYCLSDLVTDLLYALEQILDHQADKRDKSVGYRIKKSPDKSLEGYDFMDIATKDYPVNTRATTLRRGGLEWSRFVRAVDAPVLFGKDFGDMLEPVCDNISDRCTVCFWNCACPTGFETLAVPISELDALARKRGEKLGSSWLIEGFHLDIPHCLFRRCSMETCEKQNQPRIRRLHRKEPQEVQEKVESTQVSSSEAFFKKHYHLRNLLGRRKPNQITQNVGETIDFSKGGVLIGLPPPGEAHHYETKSSTSTSATRHTLYNMFQRMNTSISSNGPQIFTPQASTAGSLGSDQSGIYRHSESANSSKPPITSTGVAIDSTGAAVTSTNSDTSNDLQAKGKHEETDHRIPPPLRRTALLFCSPLHRRGVKVALPRALCAALCSAQWQNPGGLHKVEISLPLVCEVQFTYTNFLNSVRVSSIHSALANYTGFRYCCWCVGCASWRFRAREIKKLSREPSRKRGAPGWSAQLPYDPEIEVLMGQEATCWNQVEFRDLWPRILELDHHLQAARPWNFWILFRDNRDTVQYWTFLFGSIILFLTVVQVALGAAQVAG